MNKALAALLLPLAAALVACGASSDDVRDAKEGSEDRGFTVLSARTYTMESEVYVDVSFGEGGCSGTIMFDGDNATLSIDVPIPGADTETTSTSVDDPKVSDLRSISTFKQCFVAEDQP